MMFPVKYNGVEYENGDRVVLVEWGPSQLVDDNESCPPGTAGSVTGGFNGRYDFPDQLWVAWDNGSRLSPSGPADRVRKLTE